MKPGINLPLVACCALILAAKPAAAQAESIHITVRITPSAGLAEPVRGLPLYLLTKSYADIRQEAGAGVPKLDINPYIDSLTVSKELKAWMKQHHSVSLSGEDFIHGLTSNDILGIPEFRNAYLNRNAGDKAGGFPSPKYKESDRTRNPEKYNRAVNDYEAAIRKYLATNPDSKDGMDIELESIDPGHRWQQKVDAREPEIRRLTLDLAQSKYSLAQTVTDDYGHAGFANVSSGTYWLSSLGIDAQVGDTREAWDTPVTVSAGAPTEIVLSNFNAAPPVKRSQ